MLKKRMVRTGLLIALLFGFILPVIAGEYTVFGPQRYERGSGKPTTVTSTFASPVIGPDFTLRLHSGDDQGKNRVASGTIALNGGAIVGPADFRQQVQGLERSVPLAAQNALSVQLASSPGSYLTVAVVGVDNTPPLLTISAPPDNATTEAATVDVLGTVSDATPVSISVNGLPAVVSGDTFRRAAIPLQYGANTIRVIAVDLGNNHISFTHTVTRKDLTPPQLTITAPAPGSTTELESIAVSGTVSDLNAVTVTVNGLVATVVGEAFTVPEVALAVGDNSLTVVATDSWGNAATTVVTVTRQVVRPPVEPQPEGAFGAQYQDLIPADTKKTSYDPKRFSLITGEVKGLDNQPIAGVTVSVGAGSCVECHGQEYGTVKTNAEGRFTIPVEGGATMTVTYNKTGLIPSHRQVYVPWNAYAIADTAVLIPQDSAATTVVFDGNPATVVAHRSTPVSDAFGQRAATLVFSGDNQAYEVDAGGNVIRELSSITTRATEFVTPESMPAALPPSSAYTYCAEFSVDGVQRVKFAKPVIGWVDNFLGFDVGEIVPVGYYDRDRGVWVPSDNGRVVRLLDTDGNGSVDALDSDGDNFPNDLNGDGSFLDEVKGLEDPARYQSGATFWRFSVTHFTPWDCNWPYGPPSDAISPNPPTLPFADLESTNPIANCTTPTNSYVDDRSRVYHEDISIPGTDFTLHYSSSRVEGYRDMIPINVPVSGNEVPPSLKNIFVTLEVGGRRFDRVLPAMPNQIVSFAWDGRDGLGKRLGGRVQANVKIGFLYDLLYQSPLAGSFSVFGLYGAYGASDISIRGRQDIIAWVKTTIDINLAPNDSEANRIYKPFAEGWSLSNYHLGLPTDSSRLYKGDGSIIANNALVIKHVAGGFVDHNNDMDHGDGGPAVDAEFVAVGDLTVDGAGNIFVLDSKTVRKIDTEGIITTVAGVMSGEAVDGDGGPAIQARLFNPYAITVDNTGNLYILDTWDVSGSWTGRGRVRKVDTNGIITTVAGANDDGHWGDGLPATEGSLHTPRDFAVDQAGNLFIAEPSRIRKVDTAGVITAIAGKYEEYGYAGDGGQAKDARFGSISAIAIGLDGNLYVADYYNESVYYDRIRKIDPSGKITAMSEELFYIPFNIGSALEVDIDGNVYVAESQFIRRIDPAGRVLALAGGTGMIGIEVGSALGAPVYPLGIALDPQNKVFFTSEGGGIFTVTTANGLAQKLENGDVPFAEEGGLGHMMTSAGLHRRTVDLDTGVTLQEFTHDANGQLIAITDRFGSATQIERDAADRPVAIVSPDGRRTELIIDGSGHLVRVTYPDDSHYDFEYTGTGLMTAETDPNGNVFEHQFNLAGRLTVVTDPEGGNWGFGSFPQASGEVLYQKVTGEGNRTTYRDLIDASGAFSSVITGPSGGTTTVTRSADGQTDTAALSCGMETATTNGLDTEYRFTYPKQRVEETPAGRTRILTRSRLYHRASELPPDGGGDDPRGGIDPRGGSAPSPATTDFAAGDEVISIEEILGLNGRETRLVTHLAEGKREAISPLGRKVTAFYDSANLLTKRLSVSGLLDVTYAYDAKGRPTSIGQGERQTAFVYTEQGFLTSVTDPEQRTTSYDTDVMGRVTAIHRPDLSSIGFEYDNNGNMTVMENPSSVAHGFDYNGNDAKTGYSTPQSGSYRYTYDRDRRLTETLFPSGRSLVNLYDKDRLAKVITPEGDITLNYLCATKLGSMSKGGETLTYTYDGKLVTAVKATGTLSQNLSYAYNNDFNVTAMTYAASTVNYVYDNDGLLTGSGSFTIARDAANGLPKTVSGGTYSLTRSFSSYGEVAAETTTIGGVNRFAYSLSRTPAGRISAKTETIVGVSVNFAYTYDDLGRLLTVSKDSALVEEYRYDGVGRRSYEMNAARGIEGRVLAYSDEDHLLTAGDTVYQYDLDGFLTSKTDTTGTTAYTYSSRGELLKIVKPDGKTIEFIHDPLGRRIAKKINGVVTEKYLWQGLTRLLAIYNGSNALAIRFQYAGSRMPVAMTKGGSTYYLGYDQVGSLRVITDASGNVVKQVKYDSFGNILADSDQIFSVPFGFAGGLHDRDTGLVRFGFRDYAPESGRWTAKDPIGFAGGDVDVFGYVQNNSIQYDDPSGLGVEKWIKIIPEIVDGINAADDVSTVVETASDVSEYKKESDFDSKLDKAHDVVTDLTNLAGPLGISMEKRSNVYKPYFDHLKDINRTIDDIETYGTDANPAPEQCR